MGWATGFRFSAGAGTFSPRCRVQTGFETHVTSHPMGTGGSFPGDKAAGAWSYTSTPPYVFMALCLVKHRDNYTFSLPRLGPAVAHVLKIFTFSVVDWGGVWEYHTEKIRDASGQSQSLDSLHGRSPCHC
jgi:hypothetical protein